MGKREVAADVPAGAPLWVVTFGDMVSLLVTFFVLLYTFSTTEESKLGAAMGAWRGSDGVMTSRQNQASGGVKPYEGIVSTELAKAGPGKPPVNRELEEERELFGKVQSSEFNVPVDLDRSDGALRIRIAGDRLFPAGKIRINAEGQQVGKEIGLLYRIMPVRIIVEAHVDPHTPALSGYASPEEMSRDMALEVAELISVEAGWSPTRIGVCAMGSSRPLQPNDTALGRSRNRRIEVVVRPDHGDRK